MGTVIIDKTKLAKDIKKYMETVAVSVANNAADQLTEIAHESILDFYADYTPKVYQRTFDYRDNSVIRYYHNNGSIIYGGVKISSENMSPYGSPWGNAQIDPYYIAESASYGYHGLLGNSYVTKAPIESVREYFYSSKFRKDLIKKAHDIAKKQQYDVLNFR